MNPAAAQKLFGNNQLTFGTLLQKFQEGKEISLQYRSQYNDYRDKLTTGIKYLETQKEYINQKLVQPLKEAGKKMNELNELEDKNEAIQQFIKERKKQLIDEAIQYIGKSKYLIKINKEAFYYVETLKNYKELFNDPAKGEEVLKVILNKIPAFQHFMQKNSMLAGLFGMPGNPGSALSLAGLQTRASVQSLIQSNIAAGGPNAMQQVQQNIQSAQTEIKKLKDKLLNPLAGTGGGSLPDFKPNMEKTKTFRQRLEFGTNFQFGHYNKYMPTTADIGLSIGYKINEKSIAGIGASYKLGMGSIQHIQISNQGASLRSFLDWKLKKQFFISGGFEMNYLPILNETNLLLKPPGTSNWQQSALLGISKKVSFKAKWFKQTTISIQYDFLCYQHIPASQPVVFRVGYNF